jgi:hypothetical protein
MRNTEKVRRSAAPNLLVQFPLAELTLQLVVDPSKSRRSILVRADGKSRRSIPAKADGRSQQEPTVDPDTHIGRIDRYSKLNGMAHPGERTESSPAATSECFNHLLDDELRRHFTSVLLGTQLKVVFLTRARSKS